MPIPPGLDIETHPRGVIVPVRASAGARRNGILGVRNGALRIAVTVAPEKGKANSAINLLLSKAVGIPKSAVELVAGQTSRTKKFLLITDDTDELCQRLAKIIGDATSADNSQ